MQAKYEEARATPKSARERLLSVGQTQKGDSEQDGYHRQRLHIQYRYSEWDGVPIG